MIVLDASALVALVLKEPGADAVEAAVSNAVMSSANYAEALTRLGRFGGDIDDLVKSIDVWGVAFIDVTPAQAITAAKLYVKTKVAGLSLGDRLCLALALERDEPAMTAERSWPGLPHGANIILIR